MTKTGKNPEFAAGGAAGDTRQKIGLAGAVEIIIGTVIGSGIYIMIGPLAAAAGPGLFLCYLIALVVAVAASICYAQVASVFPATAATYRYTKMFYGDFIGFAVGWFRLVGSFCGLALMSSGFADYVSVYLAVDKRITAAAVLLTIVSLVEDLLILYSFGFWTLAGWVYYYVWQRSRKRRAQLKPTR